MIAATITALTCCSYCSNEIDLCSIWTGGAPKKPVPKLHSSVPDNAAERCPRITGRAINVNSLLLRKIKCIFSLK